MTGKARAAGPLALSSGVVGSYPLELDGVLERLLVAADADAAEVFLASPAGDELVLAGHRGRSPRAFRQVLRFPLGVGFPGLVASSGEPLVSLDLRHDVRFQRPLVIQQGFSSYACVPITGESGLVGTIHLAYRRRPEAALEHLPLLRQVGRELGQGLEIARLRLARAVAGVLFDPNLDAAANLRQVARHGLSALVAATGADRGLLFLADERSGHLEPALAWPEPARPPRSAGPRSLGAGPCANLSAQELGRSPACGTADEPALCRALPHDVAQTICLPLLAGGRKVGVVALGYLHPGPTPGRHFALLPAAAEALATTLHNAQAAARAEGRALRRAVAPIAVPLPAPARVAAAPFLDLRCLGSFSVARDGQLLPARSFVRRRSLTLLKLLVTRRGKQLHREELIELLWPEGDPRLTARLFAVAVHYLRRALEPDALAGQPSSFIGRRGDYYYFDSSSPHRLDADEFSAAALQGARLEAEGRPAEALAAYQSAAALYAGDYLEDERYSDWCTDEREHLRQQFLAVLARLARLQRDQGDVEAAIATLRSALRAEPTLEETHRALMETLWQAGRRDEALAQYARCRQLLQTRLGLGPAPETEALRQRIAATPAPHNQ
ncbi:MAG: BTAD domain-containing putative transcriptional regulator [Chloroflexota bacterium]